MGYNGEIITIWVIMGKASRTRKALEQLWAEVGMRSLLLASVIGVRCPHTQGACCTSSIFVDTTTAV